MTKFEYWKKVYILYGDEFEYEQWAFVTGDGFNAEIHGRPSDGNVQYVILLNDNRIMKFTDKFFEELENE